MDLKLWPNWQFCGAFFCRVRILMQKSWNCRFSGHLWPLNAQYFSYIENSSRLQNTFWFILILKAKVSGFKQKTLNLCRVFGGMSSSWTIILYLVYTRFSVYFLASLACRVIYSSILLQRLPVCMFFLPICVYFFASLAWRVNCSTG